MVGCRRHDVRCVAALRAEMPRAIADDAAAPADAADPPRRDRSSRARKRNSTRASPPAARRRGGRGWCDRSARVARFPPVVTAPSSRETRRRSSTSSPGCVELGLDDDALRIVVRDPARARRRWGRRRRGASTRPAAGRFRRRPCGGSRGPCRSGKSTSSARASTAADPQGRGRGGSTSTSCTIQARGSVRVIRHSAASSGQASPPASLRSANSARCLLGQEQELRPQQSQRRRLRQAASLSACCGRAAWRRTAAIRSPAA